MLKGVLRPADRKRHVYTDFFTGDDNRPSAIEAPLPVGSVRAGLGRSTGRTLGEDNLGCIAAWCFARARSYVSLETLLAHASEVGYGSLDDIY